MHWHVHVALGFRWDLIPVLYQINTECLDTRRTYYLDTRAWIPCRFACRKPSPGARNGRKTRRSLVSFHAVVLCWWRCCCRYSVCRAVEFSVAEEHLDGAATRSPVRNTGCGECLLFCGGASARSLAPTRILIDAFKGPVLGATAALFRPKRRPQAFVSV